MSALEIPRLSALDRALGNLELRLPGDADFTHDLAQFHAGFDAARSAVRNTDMVATSLVTRLSE